MMTTLKTFEKYNHNNCIFNRCPRRKKSRVTIRLRGVFATQEEAEAAAKNLKVYKAVITYNHGDFI